MNPKQKAAYLVLKYMSKVVDRQLAKQCSLVAVDEIIEELSVLPYGLEYLNRIDYWTSVKEEIGKL
jgi:hypothetical protein